MNVIIYEDKTEHFEPLIDFYPQFFLRLGMMTIQENMATFFKREKVFHIARPRFNNKNFDVSGPALYLSARAIILKRIAIPDKDMRFLIESQPIGFIKQKPPYPKNLKEIRRALKNIRTERGISGSVVSESWDLIRLNQQIFLHQFASIKPKHNSSKHAYIIGRKSNLHIDHRACVHKYVTIDLTNGPVYIDRDVIISPFSTIVGPAYIGPNTIVDRAKITGSSIGPFCRIGGEVEACIFQGYANKHHDGYIGHSFIGEWVNLGALTTNSDLKNNYGTVRISRGKRQLDSGMRKLGCFIGDHAKTGIGTLIPTGAKIGSFTNFFGGGMMPKNVPSFTWLNTTRKTKYDLEKAITTARTVMRRRKVILSKYYEGLIRSHYKWQSSL
jgi:UDP-N-acetylglucosamine diphosphorylase/glucosamine-1-phosphate N-acetyltransferase